MSASEWGDGRISTDGKPSEPTVARSENANPDFAHQDGPRADFWGAKSAAMGIEISGKYAWHTGISQLLGENIRPGANRWCVRVHSNRYYRRWSVLSNMWIWTI